MDKWKNLNWIALIAALALIVVPACKSASKAEKGAVIGASTGGAAGALLGKEKGKTALGFIIGAAVGGAAGTLIGNYMDKQAEELEDSLEGAEVERVGEGILITFDSGLLFDFDSDALRAETRENLQELANTLDDYDETNVLIEGHTDSKGSEDYNESLSRQRARSVANYLGIQGIDADRFLIKGYGEEQPVATNETERGRQLNRRVEVAIVANEELQEDAKDGRISSN